MKILVTGGAGFIGSAVIRHIVRHTSDSVVNVDKLTYAGHLESLAEASESERYAFERVDVCAREDIEGVFARHQPDALMHLAAETHVDRSIDGPSAFIQTNIIGTSVLLDVALSYVRGLSAERRAVFRFHHVSTDEVYGELLNDDERFSEETRYAPGSPYAATKASSDHLVRAWGRTYGLPVVVTNCSNNYGPCQFPEKLVPLMILNALEGRPLPVYGRGLQVRDWLYVEDHANALCRVLARGRVGETYNIGGNCELKNIEAVHAICDVLEEHAPQKPTNVRAYKDLIAFVADRPGHDMRYAIDSTKLCRELHWSPEETFHSGIRKTVEWYLNNREWCRQVQSGRYGRERLGVIEGKRN